MPDWLQALNAVNPISYVIEACRPLMITGYDWGAIGAALLAIVVVGHVLQGATLWAFARPTN